MVWLVDHMELVVDEVVKVQSCYIPYKQHG